MRERAGVRGLLTVSKLQEIKNQLKALRCRRQQTRWGTAYAALAIVVLWALAILFVLDVWFELNAAQRLAMLAIGAGVVLWAFRRFTRPFLGIRESETTVALDVERQYGIDSDLVAALQFERPEAAQWGSHDLETAVVSRIAELTPQLDVFRGMRYDQLVRRAKLLATSLLVALVVTLIYPRYVAVFFSRLLLSSRHYPSNTTLETVFVNADAVLQRNSFSLQPRPVKCAQGTPVRFLVHATGELPSIGNVECRSQVNRLTRLLELRKLTSDERLDLYQETAARLAGERDSPAQGKTRRRQSSETLETLLSGWKSDDAQAALYLAEMPQLFEGFQYSVRLGDAWTDPATLHMLELPAVEVAVQAIPPDYVHPATPQAASSRHPAVLEGSEVQLLVRSLNKPLQGATIRLTQPGGSFAYSLSKQDAKGFVWSIPAVDSPLARVTQEIRYEVQVTDLDGLGLEVPLHGYVQLKPDRPPSATAHVVHRVVLPSAKPIIEYRISDDYGIAEAKLHIQVEPHVSRETGEQATPRSEKPLEIPLDPRPLIGQNLPRRGKFALDLSPLKLEKGDQLKVTLEVVDYRGPSQGRSYLSEPLLLEISDEAGVLAAITEADERSEKRLNELIQQQLGVGGARDQ